jgi:DNA topoisomerase-1
MAKKRLIVVESPAKARTIQRFAGAGFQVKASMGHVRDLPKNPKKKGDPDWIGVDEEHDFTPHYVILSDKKRPVEEILASAKNADEVFLAGDPDREGEAICWHLEQILLQKKVKAPIRRILFHEITRSAVRAAIEHPQSISPEKVDAQQARRILDRIVGYRVSPLLWDKVRRGLSAGRVQTVALRMIVEREREIRDFRATEYWTVMAALAGEAATSPFEAKLVGWRGEDVPWRKESTDEGRIPALPDEAAAREAEVHIRAAQLRVAEIEAKRTRRSPPPPFTTSKLQQEAARRFHFPVRSTMRIAQALYEGKDLGELGQAGLITYMRTDSVRVAQEAIDAVREHIRAAYGEAYLPHEARVFRQKGRTQDAHEAIRPTSLELPPEKVAKFLNDDERKLYGLIWNRFVASQMSVTEIDVTRVDISAGEARLRATGQVVRFAGWRQVYQELKDEEETNGNGAEGALPPLTAGMLLSAQEVRAQQNFTQPPPRYSEAMLVRALEENGIGRPSTYASILSVISDKDYVLKEEGRFRPSRLGEIVVDLLVKHFGDIFAVSYTARLEEELDKVEEGSKRGVETLRSFATKFRRDLKRARVEMENVKGRAEKTDFICELCGSPMVKRWGRFGEFLACERYPECRGTRDLDDEAQPAPTVEETCPQCGKPMTLRRGRWGIFLACTGYPECRTTRRIRVANGTVEVKHEELLEERCPECGLQLARKHGRFGEYIGCSGYPGCRHIKREETGVACPQPNCGGMLVARRTRGRRRFFGCSRYPECTYAVWDLPVPRACAQCGHPFMLERETKRDGPHHACPQCGAKVPREPASADAPA